VKCGQLYKLKYILTLKLLTKSAPSWTFLWLGDVQSVRCFVV